MSILQDRDQKTRLRCLFFSVALVMANFWARHSRSDYLKIDGGVCGSWLKCHIWFSREIQQPDIDLISLQYNLIETFLQF